MFLHVYLHALLLAYDPTCLLVLFQPYRGVKDWLVRLVPLVPPAAYAALVPFAPRVPLAALAPLAWLDLMAPLAVPAPLYPLVGG